MVQLVRLVQLAQLVDGGRERCEAGQVGLGLEDTHTGMTPGSSARRTGLACRWPAAALT